MKREKAKPSLLPCVLAQGLSKFKAAKGYNDHSNLLKMEVRNRNRERQRWRARFRQGMWSDAEHYRPNARARTGA